MKELENPGDIDLIPNSRKNNNSFIKIDKQGDFFSNFFFNFFSQLKDPTSFIMFDVSSKDAKSFHIQNLDKLNSTFKTTNQNIKTMSATTPSSEKEYLYSTDQIDWNTMSKFGLNQEKLEKLNALDPLLRGFKTNGLVPITMNLGTAVSKMDVRLSLQTNDTGDVVINLHSIRKEPSFNYPFLGHEFTQEDKKNLMETGNMGRIVDLVNPKTDEIIPSVISRDRLTNELIAYRAENIKIPDEIKGVPLDAVQKQTLMEGNPLYIEGMLSKKGELFNASVQFNADKKYVEFLFDRGMSNQQSHGNHAIADQSAEIPRTFRGKELNDEQYDQFKAGQTIYIDGLIDKKDQKYQGYITFNRDTGKIDFSFKNPNNLGEQAKPTEAHATQVAINSEGKTNEATKNIKEPLQSAQQTPKDKKQQEKQQKPKTPAKPRSRKI
ncbi:DUF3945 domain-containing protein [Chryseobacterium sp. ISL-6]|uniref:DUF3945 domain-containing protein n=1 Tax=Chryseobacterium sp. ISL-6 TaxID=2819143 RepID=UPI001BE8DAD7|nr:DUF3945 domain-containing protein [Chryseobacterium sp. ISL-6]MBT2623602.1 DUF3945 domain-containing protein [Chryseobacterium sp. ISL-6]